jgi:hypothetical protein
MTKDPVHSEQIKRFCRRIATHAPQKVWQRIGDCAETVPLAIMANMRGGGSVVTITVLTNVVKIIRPIRSTALWYTQKILRFYHDKSQ